MVAYAHGTGAGRCYRRGGTSGGKGRTSALSVFLKHRRIEVLPHAGTTHPVTRHPPIRVFYAFDPRRVAILLIGRIKIGKEKRFYKKYIPLADKLYERHLKS